MNFSTFFSLHKERFLRQLLIRDIEKLTGRRLLIFFSHPDARPPINTRDQEGFSEILNDLVEGDEFDLLIESNGGDTDTADSIISLLGGIGKFRAIVPNNAKSNATLIALAATEIVMGPNSEIGPIEPLFNGVPATFWAQKRFKIHKDHFININHEAAKNAIRHTFGIAANLLEHGMMEGRTPEEIHDTVSKLCADIDSNGDEQEGRRQFFSHGATINSHQAEDLNLSVKQLKKSDELERKLRYLFAIYAKDARTFGYSKMFETNYISNMYVFDDDDEYLQED